MAHDKKRSKYAPIPEPLVPSRKEGWAPVYKEHQYPSSGYRVRNRDDVANVKLGIMTDSVGGKTEVTTSQSRWEECTDRLNPGPPYKSGGGFLLQWSEDYLEPTYVATQGFLQRRYDGLMIPRTTLPYLIGHAKSRLVPPLSAAQLDALGSDAWARFKPGNPSVQSGQFIYELGRLPSIDILIAAGREILGMKQNLRRLVNLGSRYLDYEFGWKPFVSDIRSLYEITKTLDERLAKLRRDNGKPVRRRGTLYSKEVILRDFEQGGVSPPMLFPGLTGEHYGSLTGAYKIYETMKTTVTFSARFRYSIPDIGSLEWEQRAIKALYGANLTPSLLWEIMPWSWLIDWFSNVGSVLSNLSENAAENLVADYAYVMVQQDYLHRRTEKQYIKKRPNDPAGFLVEASYVHRAKTLQRQAASPFDFGLTPADLSVRQMLILAALGISRRW